MKIYLVIAYMTPDGHVPYRGEELTLIGSYKTRDQAESRAHDVEREHRCAVVDIFETILDSHCKTYFGGYEE